MCVQSELCLCMMRPYSHWRLIQSILLLWFAELGFKINKLKEHLIVFTLFFGDWNSKYLFSLDVCVCALYEGWHLKMNRRNHVHAHSNNTQHTVNCWFLLQWCDLSLNETNVTVNEEINLLRFITDRECICNNLLRIFPRPAFLCF